MDGGTKCSVANNAYLLQNVQWYDNFLVAEGLLQAPAHTFGKYIGVKCFNSPHSLLLSYLRGMYCVTFHMLKNTQGVQILSKCFESMIMRLMKIY